MTDIGKRRRVFPDAFKLEAVAAVNGGRPIAQVASELGLPDRLVRAWLRWAALRPVSASRPAAWGRAPLTRRRRSRNCGVNWIGSAWSATS